MRAVPDGAEVWRFLGRDDSAPDAAHEAAMTITAMVRSRTRGAGFTGIGDVAEVAEDLYAIILLAAARLTPNPSQVTYEADGNYAVRGGFQGFTLAELSVISAYRTTLGVA